MKASIWIIELDAENYRSFIAKDIHNEQFTKRWLEWVDKFHEPRSFSAEWKPIEKILFAGEPGEEEKESRKPIPDFTGGYVVDACSERARLVIEPLVYGQVEFLPLITPLGPYYEMNIQRIECLDLEGSTIKYFKEGGILRVVKYSLFWERLKGQHIFWIRELGTTPTFVSDEFKRVVEKNGLTGLEFYPVPLAGEE